MPKGIFLIEWDEYEGAVVKHQFPSSISVSPFHVQKIMMTHQMETESNWIIHVEKDFKAVSYLDFERGNALVFALEQFETGSDFIKVLLEMGSILLPHTGEGMDGEDFDKRLEENFRMIQSIMSTKELVLINFAEQIEELKEETLDLRQKLNILMNHLDAPDKLLLFIALYDNSTLGDIESKFVQKGMEKEEIKEFLDQSIKQEVLVLDPATKGYSINLSSKLLDDVREISIE